MEFIMIQDIAINIESIASFHIHHSMDTFKDVLRVNLGGGLYHEFTYNNEADMQKAYNRLLNAVGLVSRKI